MMHGQIYIKFPLPFCSSNLTSLFQTLNGTAFLNYLFPASLNTPFTFLTLLQWS